MTGKDLKTTLTTFMEQIWNNGDFSQVDAYVSAEYEIRSDPGDPWEGQIISQDLFMERVLYSRNTFPDLRFEIREMIEENDKVVASWIMSGTHLGDLPQLPATGKSFSVTGMTIY